MGEPPRALSRDVERTHDSAGPRAVAGRTQQVRTTSADHPKMGARLVFPTGGRRRAARRPDEPRTAFVLSGGGNQGVSQVGMLRALFERDIVPDVVIGT